MLKTITIKDITHAAASSVAGVANRPFRENDNEDGDEGEDDGMAATGVAPAQPVSQQWVPNTINIDMIRNWTPRAHGRDGCRIILKSGTAYVALDTHDEIRALIDAAQRS